MKTLIKNARIINEDRITEGDVLLENEWIVQIDGDISAKPNTRVIDAEGNFLLPGAIDDQVHFREPGLTHKACIETESKAAVAGGITSYIEMPNTLPQTTSLDKLEEKFGLAAQSSWANYSFMLGGTNENLEEIKKLKPRQAAGIKLFLGSSTGNMLVDNPQVLEAIFSNTERVIAVHCEDENTIQANTALYFSQYGDNIPIEAHPLIRSEEACYRSSSMAIELARKTGARLHVFHLSTAAETELFTNKIPLEEKKITAEVCIHHLWFSENDYAKKGALIKWNPSIKKETDRDVLWKALNDDRIDVIATDHAPHTLAEKKQPYLKAPSGGPLVQHALCALFEASLKGLISPEKIVRKFCHNPAVLFDVDKRGFVKPGYYADLVLLNPAAPWTVNQDNILYRCGWSPFEGTNFKSRITHTFVNGKLVYQNGKFAHFGAAKRLEFNR